MWLVTFVEIERRILMAIKMYGLQLGRFGMDIEMLLTGDPKRLLSRDQTQKRKTFYQCPALAYVIETPEGRILYETGVSSRWNEEWPDEHKNFANTVDFANIKAEEFLEHRLKAIGLGPEDFRYVVAGHMHADHAGGLRLFEKAGTEILIHEDEYKGVMSLENDTSSFHCFADFEFFSRKRPTLMYGDQEIVKGVRLVSLPGHSWGTMGMLVRLDHTGWVFLTTDAMYQHESYGPPAIGSLYQMDQNGWGKSLEKIRRYATKYDALIAPGHDECGVKHHADGSKEFVQLKYYPGVYE
jgi:glyoxylase-like metal-dependent hydrolase (beta-lactamase superfamily II)